jgi:hypothetical protein
MARIELIRIDSRAALLICDLLESRVFIASTFELAPRGANCTETATSGNISIRKSYGFLGFRRGSNPFCSTKFGP